MRHQNKHYKLLFFLKTLHTYAAHNQYPQNAREYLEETRKWQYQVYKNRLANDKNRSETYLACGN